jgi:hypothetical protein
VLVKPTSNNSLNRSANSAALIENLNDFEVVCARLSLALGFWITLFKQVISMDDI